MRLFAVRIIQCDGSCWLRVYLEWNFVLCHYNSQTQYFLNIPNSVFPTPFPLKGKVLDLKGTLLKCLLHNKSASSFQDTAEGKMKSTQPHQTRKNESIDSITPESPVCEACDRENPCHTIYHVCQC